MTLFDEFQWRGMVSDATDGVRDALATGQVTAYIGFDPTASSLHVGIAAHGDGARAAAARRAHAHRARRRRHRDDRRPQRQVAGARSCSRRSRSTERRRRSRAARALPRFFRRRTPRASSTTPTGWAPRRAHLPARRGQALHGQLHAAEGLGAAGAWRADGISYTEFSYMRLAGVRLPAPVRSATVARCKWVAAISGATSRRAWISIRRVRGKKAHGLAWPLLKTAAGTKFGKTEAGTVWLDPRAPAARVLPVLAADR